MNCTIQENLNFAYSETDEAIDQEQSLGNYGHCLNFAIKSMKCFDPSCYCNKFNMCDTLRCIKAIMTIPY